MCINFLLGSVFPLPISSYAPIHHDETDRHIYVSSIGKAKRPDEKAIFSNRVLYSINTQHTGDACGFIGSYCDAVNSRYDLADFFEHSLKYVSDLQLFVAYHDFGKSGVIPSRLDQIGPSDIRTWMEYFNAGDFFQLVDED